MYLLGSCYVRSKTAKRRRLPFAITIRFDHSSPLPALRPFACSLLSPSLRLRTRKVQRS
jgi:hypothetical protein